MAKYLVGLVDISDLGVNNGGNLLQLEEYIKDAWGSEFSLGLEVDTELQEVCNEFGDVAGYVFMVPEELAS